MNKIYACSDLHGNFNLYSKINNFIGSSDVVYFLGDAADRGLDGWKCIKAIYNNPQWVYLKGNHEAMMADSFYDAHEYGMWMMNGGRVTLDQFEMDCDDERERRKWYRRIDQLPLSQTVINANGETIYLTHSGAIHGDDFDKVWDREHFYWSDELGQNEKIVHGHTPVQSLRQRIETGENMDSDEFDPSSVCVYADGRKVDIDCGTSWTNKVALIDLDSFEVIYFTD